LLLQKTIFKRKALKKRGAHAVFADTNLPVLSGFINNNDNHVAATLAF
jgi:hypothetical protein